MYNDGTGPQYDRPAVIDRHTVRRDEARAAKRAADAEREANWEKYQAFLAAGLSEEDARTGTWPDHAIAYLVGADGEEVIAPIDRDGFAILPEGYGADEDEPADDESGDEDSTETGTGDAQGDAPGSDDTETGDDADEDESDAQTGADGSDGENPPADPEAQAEDAAAAQEIADGADDDSTGDPADEKPADEGYEPADHTVADVQTYLGEHPDQTEYVLDRERGGKARVSLIGA